MDPQILHHTLTVVFTFLAFVLGWCSAAMLVWFLILAFTKERD